MKGGDNRTEGWWLGWVGFVTSRRRRWKGHGWGWKWNGWEEGRKEEERSEEEERMNARDFDGGGREGGRKGRRLC
jgi:hypothetical protein